MHKTLTTEQNSRQKLELKQSDELSSILMKSSFLGANTDGSEVTRTILDLQEAVKAAKLETFYAVREKEKSHEELKDLQNKLESALSALADEQERASASFTLLENMKLKMGTMVEEDALKKLAEQNNELLSQSLMLANQKDLNENREKEIRKLQSEIEAFQNERVQHLECTKAVKGKLEEEQANIRRAKKDLEDLKLENNNLKAKIESQQNEIGRFIQERNEQGEMKAKLITLNDKLSRKENELLEQQNKFHKLQKDFEVLQIQVNNSKALSSEHNELVSQQTKNIETLEQKLKEKERLVGEWEQKFHVSLQGNEYLQNEKKKLEETIVSLEAQIKDITEKKRLLAEQSIKYKEEVSLQLQQLTERNTASTCSSPDIKMLFKQIQILFPDLELSDLDTTATADLLKLLVTFLSNQNHHLITFDDFKSGNIVVLYPSPSSNDNYEIATTSASTRYIMDPDSVTEAFDALLKNKKPFLAQIVYISEQMTSRGSSNDFKLPTGTIYYIVTTGAVPEKK